MYRLGSKSKRNLKLIYPPMRCVVEKAITITKQDFSVHSGARTAKQQNDLYQIGRTVQTHRAPVTSKDGYKNKSNHQVDDDGWGRGVDLVPYVAGRGLVWDWELIYPIAVAMSKAARELSCCGNIRWGGNWYEMMSQYDATISSVAHAVQRYKRDHPGPDHIDGPHFEYRGK
jgi:peptidoglycan LD-endopeptidase CwlK